MAEVHVARLRARPDRLVALKVIRPELIREPGFVAMFLDEARIATRLAHPNIATMFGLGNDAGRHYIVMELLRGRTLLEVATAATARDVKLPRPMVAWIAARVADALHFAHELRDDAGAPSQLVHRDVNPANVFICSNGDPKVIDFGLAKAKDRIGSTAIGVVKGKLAYLSPEQAQGQPVDRRSDVFSLGIAVWELTLGRRLFLEGSDVSTMKRVIAGVVPDPTSIDPEYPEPLAKAVRRALAPDPKDRFASADEFAKALDEYVRDAGGCDAAAVAAFVARVFPGSPAAEWEAVVFPRGQMASIPDDAPTAGSVRVWDEDEKKLTWMPAVTEVSEDAPKEAPAAPAPRTRRAELDAALVARIATLEAANDRAGVARAHLERSLVDEVLGDASNAVAYAELALAAHDSAPAHATLRRLLPARGAERALLVHLDAEIAATTDAGRADRLAERGRLLRASGDGAAEVRHAFERALEHTPRHAAAMKGLEEALSIEGSEADLARHLGEMAEAYAADPELAAWLRVERAELLERDVKDIDGARSVLKSALALDAKIGPVREACVRHAALHREWAWLSELFDEEAKLEASATRAAALELDAACIERLVFDSVARATELLERAASRAPTTARIDRRVLGDLVTLHERAANTGGALGARRRRLAFVEDAVARAVELRTIAALEESRGDTAAAIAALTEARAADPSDSRAAESMDRWLAAAGRHGERVAIVLEVAARAVDTDARAEILLRASALAESMDDLTRATELARACLVAKPADQGAVDALSRLLASVPTEATSTEARARIAIHAHAADHATDGARRVAHLEAVALLNEEMLGDFIAAATTYEAILAIEPGRRGALVGLARNARRAKDHTRWARALLDEAATTGDAKAADALRVRAAAILAERQPDRALALATEVLARDPANGEARRIQQRIHEAAGRWGEVDGVLAARIDAEPAKKAKATLHVARAELLRTRLRDTSAALEALRAAFAIAPSDELRAMVVELLESQGDPKKTRAALVKLADAAQPHAETLARAAEIDELVLGDDDGALALLERAIEIDPADAALAARRARIVQRTSRVATKPPTREEAERAIAASPRAPSSLRLLEAAARRSGSAPLLANALHSQSETWRSESARAGTLYALFWLLERELPANDPVVVLDAILALVPNDVAALDARVRYAVAAIRRGARADSHGPTPALAARAGDRATGHLDALRRRVAGATDPADRALAQLTIAMALDNDATGTDDAPLREALAWYSSALVEAPLSIVAAEGSARLGARLGSDRAQIAGTVALAEATPGAMERAAKWTHAASRLLATRDAQLGSVPERLARAFEWLERALDASPDAIPAVALLIGARTEETHRDRLVALLRRTLLRATKTDAIVLMGTELARVARLSPPDRLLAIEALRRIVAVAPTTAFAWRALADVATEQGATHDAEVALESLVANARDPQPRLAALFDLAEVYRRPPARTADVERVLRAALDADPTSERALRELVAARREANAPLDEIATLLGRLAEVARPSEAKAVVLGELADVHLATGDAPGAERALIEASASAPTTARLTRLLDFHASSTAGQARVLGALLARSEKLGRVDPAALVRLGRLEIETLGLPAEGAAHLKQALVLAPTMHDARAALARGLVDAGRAAEAVSTIASMMVPDPSPLLSLPEPALALATLERALAGDSHADEAVVARELRAVAGGLDDGAHVELRARRLAPGTFDNDAGALDRTTLLSLIAPPEIAGLPLAIAQALDGVETKMARTDVDALGITARDRLTQASDNPLVWTHAALCRVFAIEPPPLAVSSAIAAPRVALIDGIAWIIAPASLASRPEPEHAAALARALVRIALGVPWIDELPGPYVHALLAGAARRVVRGYASEVVTAQQEDLVADLAQRVSRAIGTLALKQKRALSDLEERLNAEPPLDERAAYAFTLAVARAELRAAFALSGDLLATVDTLRSSDAVFARETDTAGPRALAAVLSHPIAGDLVRFALSRQTTQLRKRLATTWTPRG